MIKDNTQRNNHHPGLKTDVKHYVSIRKERIRLYGLVSGA